MPMQPRPIAETSGPPGPSVRVFMTPLPFPGDRRTALGACPCRGAAAHWKLHAVYQSRSSCPARGPRHISFCCVFPANLPNVLTVLRIMLVPALVVALLG